MVETDEVAVTYVVGYQASEHQEAQHVPLIKFYFHYSLQTILHFSFQIEAKLCKIIISVCFTNGFLYFSSYLLFVQFNC